MTENDWRELETLRAECAKALKLTDAERMQILMDLVRNEEVLNAARS